MPYVIQIWYKEPLAEVQCTVGVKGHAGVSRGQQEVRVVSNTQRLPNLVGRTLTKVTGKC